MKVLPQRKSPAGSIQGGVYDPQFVCLNPAHPHNVSWFNKPLAQLLTQQHLKAAPVTWICHCGGDLSEAINPDYDLMKDEGETIRRKGKTPRTPKAIWAI